MTTCALEGLVDRHFRLRIKPKEEESLRSHLSACQTCKERYERHLLYESIVNRGVDPKHRLMSALGLRRSRWRFTAVGVPLVVAAAAAVSIAVILPTLQGTGTQFRERGGSDLAPDFAIYRIQPKSRPQPVLDAISKGDSLAFAYKNPSGRRYLMVFAVDEQRHIYWYFPRWDSASDNPTALPISRTDQWVEIPEAVQHSFNGDRVTIHGLLLDKPITVQQVEEQIHASRGPLDRALELVGSRTEPIVLKVLQ